MLLAYKTYNKMFVQGEGKNVKTTHEKKQQLADAAKNQ